MREGLEAVEEEFVGGSAGGVRLLPGDQVAQGCNLLVELRPRLRAMRVADLGVERRNRMDRARAHGLQEAVADRMPVLIRSDRWDGQNVSHARHRVVTPHRFRHQIELFLVERRARLARVRRLSARGQRGGQRLELLGEVLSAFRTDAVLEPLVKDEGVPQVDDGALIG